MKKYPTIPEAENFELIKHINDVIEMINCLSQEQLYFLSSYLFFSTFIKFQNFVHNIFELYALGKTSSQGYTPTLKHSFSDNKELRAFLGGKKDYIEYDDKINLLSEYIFHNDMFDKLRMMNPFPYNQLIDIRNHIAHESDHSKKKLNEQRILKSEESVSDLFLKKKKGRTDTYLNCILKNIKETSDYLIKP